MELHHQAAILKLVKVISSPCLINRSSGIPNLPNSGVIDEIPRVGPITITMAMPRRPKNVSLGFEDAAIQWDYRSGQNSRQVKIEVPSIHIHAAVVVEEGT